MGELDKMRDRILQINDINDSYSLEDFDKEFSNLSTIDANQDYFKINLGFANKSDNQDPDFATAGSSGFDLRAFVSETTTIPSGKRAIVPTGLFFEIPENFEIQVRPRSGLAAKNGVTVLNTPGTIDADYRGEVKVILINHDEEAFVINNGDRIAQAVLCPVFSKNFVKLDKLDDVSKDTERSDGGFGHTGTK